MTEHGVPDARRTKRKKGISHVLPDDHHVGPDGRRNRNRTKGRSYDGGGGAGAPAAPDVANTTPKPKAPAKKARPGTKARKLKDKKPE